VNPLRLLVGRWLLPAAYLIAAALLLRGYVAVGDGFSAGAMAALGALAREVCTGRKAGAPRRSLPRIGVAGLLLVLVIALGPLLVGAPPVSHLPRPGAPTVQVGVVELHTAFLFDLGLAILVYAAIRLSIERLLAAADPPGGAR